MCYCCNVCHFMSMNFHRRLYDLAIFYLKAEMLHIVWITIAVCYILVNSEYWCVDSLSLRSSPKHVDCAVVYTRCVSVDFINE